MANRYLDKLVYQNLTGFPLDESQEQRYYAVLNAAVAQLEQILGWPLLPDSWDNQYLEIGKSKNNLSCPAADAELDPPDTPVGKTRIFTLYPGETWMHIDPAIAIHTVKWIKGNITCIDYDQDAYVEKYANGTPTLIKWIGIRKLMCDCIRMSEPREFAIDADWAYEVEDDDLATIPNDLKKVLADMVAEEMDLKKDIKSESVVSHSYTRFERALATDRNAALLRRYAGPHGLANRRLS